jgi:hypothetical protein
MLSGCPVISAALSSIPNKYHKFVYILQDETPEELARLIRDACSKLSAEIDEFGRRARAYILQTINWAI